MAQENGTECGDAERATTVATNDSTNAAMTLSGDGEWLLYPYVMMYRCGIGIGRDL